MLAFYLPASATSAIRLTLPCVSDSLLRLPECQSGKSRGVLTTGPVCSNNSNISVSHEGTCHKMIVLGLIFTIFVLTQECKAAADLFDIHKVEFLKSPVTCGRDITLVIVIHSHPEHIELRNTLRQTWAQETDNTRRIFVVGIIDNKFASDAISRESEDFGDMLQGDFIDSYRNMTYKHLLGYRWIHHHCSEASYVLKSDDDQFVDTLQLPRYLSAFLPAPGPWYLCQVNTHNTGL